MAPRLQEKPEEVVCRLSGKKVLIAKSARICKGGSKKKEEGVCVYYAPKNEVEERPLREYASFSTVVDGKDVHFLTCMYSKKMEEIQDQATKDCIKKSFCRTATNKEKEKTRDFVSNWIREKQNIEVNEVVDDGIYILMDQLSISKIHVDPCYTSEMKRFERVFVILEKDVLYAVAYKYNWAQLQKIPLSGNPYAFHSIDLLDKSKRNNNGRNAYSPDDDMCVQVKVVWEPFAPNWVKEKTTTTYSNRFAQLVKAKLKKTEEADEMMV